MSGGGKRIRPIIMMLSAEAFGGNSEVCLPAAIGMEILHNFTLVHDDIMDNADTRRGRETIHRKWDTNAAILVGDELIGLAYRSILMTNTARIREVVEVFTNGVIEVCDGQAIDKEFESTPDVTLDDYMIMIRKKTAELLRTSAILGAVIADANSKQIEMISNYAVNIGLAFQIQDDLLDVIADEEEFGKKIGGDIIEKKKTFLYLKALQLMDENDRNEFAELYNSDLNAENKIYAVIKTYSDICAMESAKHEIEKFTSKADEFLSQIESAESRSNLSGFSKMLLSRNY